MARAIACLAKGCEFKSRYSRHSPVGKSQAVSPSGVKIASANLVGTSRLGGRVVEGVGLQNQYSWVQIPL